MSSKHLYLGCLITDHIWWIDNKSKYQNGMIKWKWNNKMTMEKQWMEEKKKKCTESHHHRIWRLLYSSLMHNKRFNKRVRDNETERERERGLINEIHNSDTICHNSCKLLVNIVNIEKEKKKIKKKWKYERKKVKIQKSTNSNLKIYNNRPQLLHVRALSFHPKTFQLNVIDDLVDIIVVMWSFRTYRQSVQAHQKTTKTTEYENIVMNG